MIHGVIAPMQEGIHWTSNEFLISQKEEMGWKYNETLGMESCRVIAGINLFPGSPWLSYKSFSFLVYGGPVSLKKLREHFPGPREDRAGHPSQQVHLGAGLFTFFILISCPFTSNCGRSFISKTCQFSLFPFLNSFDVPSVHNINSKVTNKDSRDLAIAYYYHHRHYCCFPRSSPFLAHVLVS